MNRIAFILFMLLLTSCSKPFLMERPFEGMRGKVENVKTFRYEMGVEQTDPSNIEEKRYNKNGQKTYYDFRYNYRFVDYAENYEYKDGMLHELVYYKDQYPFCTLTLDSIADGYIEYRTVSSTIVNYQMTDDRKPNTKVLVDKEKETLVTYFDNERLELKYENGLLVSHKLWEIDRIEMMARLAYETFLKLSDKEKEEYKLKDVMRSFDISKWQDEEAFPELKDSDTKEFITYKYDYKGDVLEENHIKAKVYNMKHINQVLDNNDVLTYQYHSYDEKDNWVTATISRNGEEIYNVKREIVYF